MAASRSGSLESGLPSRLGKGLVSGVSSSPSCPDGEVRAMKAQTFTDIGQDVWLQPSLGSAVAHSKPLRA